MVKQLRVLYNSIFWIFFLVLGVTAVMVAGASWAQEPMTSPLVSVMFYEMDLREAFNELALQTGINILVVESVQGFVTLTVDQVPLETVIQMLCLPGGYAYRNYGNFYLVGLPDPYNRAFSSLVDTRVISLKHISAATARELLPAYADQYLSFSREESLLLVTAPPDIAQRITALIDKIDRPRPVTQYRIRALITEVATATLQQWGINSLEVTGSKDEGLWDRIWSTSLQLQSGLVGLEYRDPFERIVALFSALEEKNEAAIHADPTLIVAEGKQASLFSGETRLVTRQTDDGTHRYQSVEAGVRLTVTPTALEGGVILLEIAPEISHISEVKDDPTVYQNQVQTTLKVTDGEVVALSGLTVENTMTKDAKVPILGSLPVIRWLFKSTANSSSDRELLVFISAEELK